MQIIERFREDVEKYILLLELNPTRCFSLGYQG